MGGSHPIYFFQLVPVPYSACACSLFLLYFIYIKKPGRLLAQVVRGNLWKFSKIAPALRSMFTVELSDINERPSQFSFFHLADGPAITAAYQRVDFFDGLKSTIFTIVLKSNFLDLFSNQLHRSIVHFLPPSELDP